MKTKFASFLLIGAVAAIAITGCVSAHKKSETGDIDREFIANTNKLSFFDNFHRNPHSILVSEHIRYDRHKAGGIANFTASEAQNISGSFSNQTSLGGGSTTAVGSAKTDISTNAAPLVNAAGQAGGTLLQDGINAAKGTPVPATAPAK